MYVLLILQVSLENQKISFFLFGVGTGTCECFYISLTAKKKVKNKIYLNSKDHNGFQGQKRPTYTKLPDTCEEKWTTINCVTNTISTE